MFYERLRNENVNLNYISRTQSAQCIFENVLTKTMLISNGYIWRKKNTRAMMNCTLLQRSQWQKWQK